MRYHWRGMKEKTATSATRTFHVCVCAHQKLCSRSLESVCVCVCVAKPTPLVNAHAPASSLFTHPFFFPCSCLFSFATTASFLALPRRRSLLPLAFATDLASLAVPLPLPSPVRAPAALHYACVMCVCARFSSVRVPLHPPTVPHTPSRLGVPCEGTRWKAHNTVITCALSNKPNATLRSPVARRPLFPLAVPCPPPPHPWSYNKTRADEIARLHASDAQDGAVTPVNGPPRRETLKSIRAQAPQSRLSEARQAQSRRGTSP